MVGTRRPVFDQEWGQSVLDQVHSHMEQLYDSLDDGSEPDELTDSPFCGCMECDERERYILLIILAIEGYEAGKVRLEEVGGHPDRPAS